MSISQRRHPRQVHRLRGPHDLKQARDIATLAGAVAALPFQTAASNVIAMHLPEPLGPITTTICEASTSKSIPLGTV
ncbi:MAG: hypothetical protein KGJ38_10135 [Burkholderiaceae bacterium]|nr:hypothetical protein [Burkholderiaceae bacterium]